MACEHVNISTYRRFFSILGRDLDTVWSLPLLGRGLSPKNGAIWHNCWALPAFRVMAGRFLRSGYGVLAERETTHGCHEPTRPKACVPALWSFGVPGVWSPPGATMLRLSLAPP